MRSAIYALRAECTSPHSRKNGWVNRRLLPTPRTLRGLRRTLAMTGRDGYRFLLINQNSIVDKTNITSSCPHQMRCGFRFAPAAADHLLRLHPPKTGVGSALLQRRLNNLVSRVSLLLINRSSTKNRRILCILFFKMNINTRHI